MDSLVRELKVKPFFHGIPAIISENTSKIRLQEIVLVLDILIFFMKKHILENGSLYIEKFGKFYYSKRFRIINFKKATYLNDVLHGDKELEIRKNGYRENAIGLDVIFKRVAKILTITARDVGYIFELFLYGLTIELLENKGIKLRNFGTLYLYEYKILGGKMLGRDIVRNKIVRFEACKRFKQEVRGEVEGIYANSRVERLLKVWKIEQTIEKTHTK